MTSGGRLGVIGKKVMMDLHVWCKLIIGFLKNVYSLSKEREREREAECEQGRDREREGDTESEAGSRLRAVSTEPDTGLELTNREITTRAEVGHLSD